MAKPVKLKSYLKGQQSDGTGFRKASTVLGGGLARHRGSTPHRATRPPHSLVSVPLITVASPI